MNRGKREKTAFGKEVVKRLIDKGIEQKELADMVGMSYRYLNDIIHGQSGMGGKYIPAICEILEIELIENVS